MSAPITTLKRSDTGAAIEAVPVVIIFCTFNFQQYEIVKNQRKKYKAWQKEKKHKMRDDEFKTKANYFQGKQIGGPVKTTSTENGEG
jgi:hypothetical protein